MPNLEKAKNGGMATEALEISYAYVCLRHVARHMTCFFTAEKGWAD